MPPKRQKSTVSLGKSLIAAGLLLVLSACTGPELLNSLVPIDGYSMREGVAFGPERRHKLDLYLPDTPETAKSVVVFFYGGAWKSGQRQDYRFVAQSLASQGYVVVIPDYRLYPAVKYPAFLEDCARAVAWTHENIRRFGGNRDRIFVMGHSAGAYNAMMLALDARWMGANDGSKKWIRGAVGIAGPYDFLPIEDPSVQKVFSTALDLRTTQPITHVTEGEPPVLLLSGMEDDQVDPKNTRKLAEKLHEKGNDVKVIIYTGLTHKGMVLELATPLAGNSQMLQDIRSFIRTH